MPRPQVLAVVAFRSGAGKTTLIEGVIKELVGRGYAVCAIKHSSHPCSGDTGKDTWKYREAGAAASALLSSDGSSTLVVREATLGKVLDALSCLGAQLVICEGFKESDLPKLALVGAEEIGMALRLPSLAAIVITPLPPTDLGVPILPFDPLAVADFIEGRYLKPAEPLVDPFGRRILGIRISLTQRCNLNCLYCHHEGELSPSSEMSTGEVLRVIRVAGGLGVRRVKFTGGEPLLRADLETIISSSHSLGLEDVSITTNGIFLEERATGLSRAGLRRANVSIPSVDPEIYQKLTGGDLYRVVSGLEAACNCGISVKINMVVMKGVNESEVDRMVEFARRNASSLQLVELEDLRLGDGFFAKYHADLSEIEKRLSERAERCIERGEMNRRRVYWIGGIPVEVVRPIENPGFCSACTRIRVTSDGKIKPCLMRGDLLIDLLRPMRSGCSDEHLKALFRDAVSKRAPFYR